MSQDSIELLRRDRSTVDMDTIYLALQLELVWGILNIWMFFLGIMVYLFYRPNIPQSKWLFYQCPQDTWQKTSNMPYIWYPGKIDTGRANYGTVQTTWNYEKCKSASPVSQWLTAGQFMMLFYGASWIMWVVFGWHGHDGGTIHMIWWRLSQGTALGALISFILVAVARQSYGTRDEVAMSWFGTTLSVINGIAKIGTDTPSGWVSDYKYLLFRDD